MSKPRVNSPHAKSLELPQHRHRVIPDKRLAEAKAQMFDEDFGHDDYDEDVCRTCGGPNDDGEGFDDECGNCADRTYGAEECEGGCGKTNNECACHA